MKISIQGQVASFHHIAAQSYFNDPDILGCQSFEQTITALTNKITDFAIVAIENSLYGTINEVYDLILSKEVKICGEIYLRIEQNLISLPDASLNEIAEVYSHPVALAQCEDFLDKQLTNVSRFERHDTAGSVIDIKKWGDKSKAAIASESAAKLHGMKVLARSIETNKQNYTRFVVLCRKDNLTSNTNSNKTSIVLQAQADNKPGSLVNALNIFAKNNINITALHSRPVIGRAWHYMFYIDLEIIKSSKVYDQIFTKLGKLGYKAIVLGDYTKASI